MPFGRKRTRLPGSSEDDGRRRSSTRSGLTRPARDGLIRRRCSGRVRVPNGIAVSRTARRFWITASDRTKKVRAAMECIRDTR